MLLGLSEPQTLELHAAKQLPGTTPWPPMQGAVPEARAQASDLLDRSRSPVVSAD